LLITQKDESRVKAVAQLLLYIIGSDLSMNHVVSATSAIVEFLQTDK